MKQLHRLVNICEAHVPSTAVQNELHVSKTTPSNAILYELYVSKTISFACYCIWAEAHVRNTLCYSIRIAYIRNVSSLQYYSLWSAWPETTLLTCFSSRFSTCNETRIGCKGGGRPISAEDYLSLTSCTVRLLAPPRGPKLHETAKTGLEAKCWHEKLQGKKKMTARWKFLYRDDQNLPGYMP
jgi:hypothetical protein